MGVFVVLVAIALVGFWMLRSAFQTHPANGAEGPYPLIPGDQFTIRARGWSRAELIEIFNRFSSMYDVGEPQIVETTARTFQITWPDGLPEAQVWFAVNYLHYPFDIDLTGRTIVAAARVEPGHLTGIPATHSALLYVPQGDEDFDRIYATDSAGQAFIGDFGDTAFRPTDDSRRPREVDTLFA